MEEEGGYEMQAPVVQELGSNHKVLDSWEEGRCLCKTPFKLVGFCTC